MSNPPCRRVLLISPQPFFQWRGSPIRVSFDVRALAELGCRVDLLTMPMGSEKSVPGVRIFRAFNLFRRKDLPIGPSFWKAVYDVLLFFRAAGLVCVNRYDVIHGVEDAGIIALVLGWLSGARVVFEKHSDPSSYRRGPLRNLVLYIYSHMERLSIRFADLVITTGPGLAEQARQVAPQKAIRHILDVPSSLEEAQPARVAEIRRQLQSAPDELLVTYVGSFAIYQGIELMFASLPLAARDCDKARFVIIGGTQEQIAERKCRLAEQGIESRFSFVGKVPPDDLPNYLAASDVLLSPRAAGANAPLKLLDYMKAGRAIVATDTEANRQLLSESNAVLVTQDPAAFAAGIVRVFRDTGLRERLGAEGRRLIDEKCNFGEFRKALGEGYLLLAPPGRGAGRAAMLILSTCSALAELEVATDIFHVI